MKIRLKLPASSPERAAIAVGLLLTLGIAALHVRYHRHAGALWRDEVNSVNLASLPTAAEAWDNLHYDSFPPVWILGLHAWKRAGLAPDDAGYRRIGLAIGLATLAMLWWTGWRLGIGPPLVTLLLFGMSPSVIIYGDMVRGYGLAALAVVWSAGAIWAFVQKPTWGRYAVAQCAAIFAAQTHFANGIPLLGLGVGGAAVCWHRRAYARLIGTLTIGAVAAATLFAVNYQVLAYMANAGQQELHSSITLGWIVSTFAEALAPATPWLAAAWAAAAIVAGIGLAASLASPRQPEDREYALYGSLSLAITLVGTFYAYRRTSIPTHYWHYLSVIAMAALACEIGIWSLARRFAAATWARVAATAALALLAARSVSDAATLRMTTLDLVASEIERAARPDDLVVVFPWVCGITFDRYYGGPAPWITLPDLPDHRFHLHLVIRERMELGEAGVAAELERVEQTLRRGHRVWVVGSPVAPDPGSPLPAIGSPTDRGSAGRHLNHWEGQLGALLEQHVREGRRVPLPAVGQINAWENMPLFVVEGWR